MSAISTEPARTDTEHLDLIVIGAGFAGLYLLHRLRADGFSVRVLEAGSGVGGTWFWNRYPGARCDVESIDYSYSFSEELQQEWVWTERFAAQPEILRYLDHVADRFDLRRDIDLNSRVSSAIFDESQGLWAVETEDGARFDATYCIMATGGLSAINNPDVPGLEDFAGQWYHTARWPANGVDFTGRRVAVIGTGSTGVQAIPVIAETAQHVTVFQRTPNFSIPARNRPLDPEDLAKVKANYAERRARARLAPSGVPSDRVPGPSTGVPEEERRRVFEAGWAEGGASALLRAYSDLMVDEDANASIANFVRDKIRDTVADPTTAERLTPRDFPFGAKRLCVDSNYYETYNRDNVELVSLREAPMTRITPTGIETSEGHHEVDVIIFAIGFDAITGAVQSIDVRGRDGVALRDKWVDGPQALLGLATSGFPNLLLVNGPGSPAVLGNVVTFVEHHVEWMAELLSRLRSQGCPTIESTPEADEEWADHVSEVASHTLYPRAKSWFVGANVPGKPIRFLPYAGGADRYRRTCQEVVDAGYKGFVIGRPPSADDPSQPTGTLEATR